MTEGRRRVAWLVGPSGISTTSSVGIGTTTITNTLTVKGDGLVDGAFQIGVDGYNFCIIKSN